MTTPSVDPTANVIAVVNAAVQRQDDLRKSESEHLRELMRLRSEHADKIRTAETARLDAIRAIDVQAVNRAADAAVAQAATLAAQVATVAETMRTTVAATAQAGATSLDAALVPLKKDVADLRQFMFEQAGSNKGEMQQNIERRASTQTKVSSIGVLIAGVSLFISLTFSITGVVITLLLR